MSLFGGMFESLFNAVKSVFSSSVSEELDAVELEEFKLAFSQLKEKVHDVKPFARKADESYQMLIYEDLRKVPAVSLYDGNYQDRLAELLADAESGGTLKDVDMATEKLTQVATEVQTYLNEETCDLKSAKLWDAKFVKGVVEHIPPHEKKGVYTDDVMSEVMEAFRNWSSFAQASIDMYGSQRLINATYEAVMDGKDALEYISEIIDINEQNSSFGGGTHEHVIVPYSGFFGGGFFL